MEEKRNEQRILLSIVGEQSVPDGEPRRVEVETEGQYYEKQGAQYLEYQEHEDGGTMASTQVCVAADMVSLLRRGENPTHIVFCRGQRSVNAYQTPMGALEMAVLPTYMDVRMQRGEGNVDVEYQLEVGGRFAGNNAISIVYRGIS